MDLKFITPLQAGFFIVHTAHTQMSERRAPHIPRMGDVGLIKTSDGVFTGETLIHRIL